MSKPPPDLVGRVEYHDLRLVRGWAANRMAPLEQATLEVIENGGVLATIRPSLLRPDLRALVLGGGRPGFVYPLPAHCGDGRPHRLHFRFAVSGVELEGSPVLVERLEESRHVPYAATSLVGARVLVLAPHPDDESLACGGALVLHRRHGDPVKVIVLTDGGGDEADGPMRRAYVSQRAGECAEACRRLGVDDLEMWGLRDRGLDLGAGTVARLRQALEAYRPTLVYAPSPGEFHPDHQATSRLVWHALRAAGFSATIAFWELNRPIGVNVLVDVTAVADVKRSACDAYASQNAQRPYTDCLLGLNLYRALTLGPACRHAEGYLVLDSREFARHPPERVLARPYLPPKAGEAPLVSIVLRSRGGRLSGRDALASLLAQTYPNLEVVVAGSADGVETNGPLPVRVVAVDDPRAGKAWNAGTAAARGRYLLLMTDCEVLDPDHVERLTRFLVETGASFAYADGRVARYRWTNAGAEPLDGAPDAGAPDAEDFAFDPDRLHLADALPAAAALFTRELWERAGPLESCDEDLWRLWTRMARMTPLHRLPGATLEQRVFSAGPRRRPPRVPLLESPRAGTRPALARLCPEWLRRSARRWGAQS